MSDESQGAGPTEGGALGTRWPEVIVAAFLVLVGALVIIDSLRVGTGWRRCPVVRGRLATSEALAADCATCGRHAVLVLPPRARRGRDRSTRRRRLRGRLTLDLRRLCRLQCAAGEPGVDQVDLVEGHARLVQGVLGGGDGGGQHPDRVGTSHGEVVDAGPGGQAELVGLVLAHDEHGRGAVGDRRAVAPAQRVDQQWLVEEVGDALVPRQLSVRVVHRAPPAPGGHLREVGLGGLARIEQHPRLEGGEAFLGKDALGYLEHVVAANHHELDRSYLLLALDSLPSLEQAHDRLR